jgi:hemerythrin-like domain-containing protein
MTTPLPATIFPHPGPASGFDAPFEMLEACHQRVQRTLALLDRLAVHLADHGSDEQAQQAALDVMRYFDRAAPAHHEDEERHVLPRLRALGQAALAERLHAEHEAMAQAWAAVRADLQRVADGAPPEPAATAALHRRWHDYAALYQQHLRAEEDIAYPAVRTALVDGEALTIGREMASRRGIAAA